MSLRQLNASDMPALGRILTAAFSRARVEEGYKNTKIPDPDPNFLAMYMQPFPQGCLGWEKDGELAGYIFSRLWGAVGWFGPVAVLPKFQGAGIGKRLVNAVINQLTTAGAKTIGCETMPRNYRNLRFYARLGFDPTCLTTEMVSRVGSDSRRGLPADFRVDRFSQLSMEQQQDLLPKVDKLCQRVDPHLSASFEIQLVHQCQFGDTLFLQKADRLVGFAIGHSARYYLSEPHTVLKVSLAALRPNHVSSEADALLTALREWSHEQGFRAMTLRTPTRYKAFLSD